MNAMKEMYTKVTIEDQEYTLAFDLNVLEAIQEEYGTIKKFSELTDEAEEINIKAIVFAFMQMINEGIEIDNDENGTNKKPLSKRQVARLLTKYGMDNAVKKLNQTVIESAGVEEKNV